MRISKNTLFDALTILKDVVSSDKLKSIATSKVELSVKDGTLYGYAFDEINYIKVAITDVTEDILATVDFNSLYNIVKATRSDVVDLSSDNKALSFKSEDLNCKLPILVDSSNTIVLISDFWDNVNKPTTFKKANFETLKAYIPNIKSVLIENFVIECYSNVYFSTDKIMVTDTDNIITINQSYFDTNVLLNMRAVEFLSKLAEVEYAIDDGKLFINNDNVEFVSIIQDDSEYQYDDLNNLFTAQFDYSITISGEDYNTAIGLSKLFSYPNIDLHFTKKGLFFTIPQMKFEYRLSDTPFVSNDGKDDFTYTLKSEIAEKLLISKQELTLNYGDPSIINVNFDNIQGIFSV